MSDMYIQVFLVDYMNHLRMDHQTILLCTVQEATVLGATGPGPEATGLVPVPGPVPEQEATVPEPELEEPGPVPVQEATVPGPVPGPGPGLVPVKTNDAIK
jgi:hypothetical protein